MADHIQHLSQVLALLKSHQLYAKISKCQFGEKKLEYLGHVISSEGVAADPCKIEVMLKWPKPKCLKDLRGFLGLTEYYRKFLKQYGEIALPLTQLLKKGHFIWTESAELAFNKLKQAMVSTPVLVMPDYGDEFDASDKAIRGILM